MILVLLRSARVGRIQSLAKLSRRNDRYSGCVVEKKFKQKPSNDRLLCEGAGSVYDGGAPASLVEGEIVFHEK